MPLKLDGRALPLATAARFVFGDGDRTIEITGEARARIATSHRHLGTLIDRKIPIYGVTTGFGDSCSRTISAEQAEALQKNLISYLRCGSGPRLSREAVRAGCLFRLSSLARGFSGVSPELVDRLKDFLERDWLPVVPCSGSLGASGDLIPLAYLGAILQGEGEIETPDGIVPAGEHLKRMGVAPYRLKAKEGLALVNGTSAMGGVCLVNLVEIRHLLELSTVASAWLCLALRGRTESFGDLVNRKAKQHPGQTAIAARINSLLREENYESVPLDGISVVDGRTESLVQDRYSLRCAPQILGPVRETLELAEKWLEIEVSGASDNPLIDDDGSLAMGGNFYAGYLAHGMDYLKMGLGHLADLADRQLTFLIDEKSNRGLPPNLANWKGLAPEERHLHHGLKGLHQAVNAITSEILSMCGPSSTFSRSSESHNQDKVSLGMSAATSCTRLIDAIYPMVAMHLVCLAQALDLREVSLAGADSKALYDAIRKYVPFVDRDTALAGPLDELARQLRSESRYDTH